MLTSCCRQWGGRRETAWCVRILSYCKFKAIACFFVFPNIKLPLPQGANKQGITAHLRVKKNADGQGVGAVSEP